jgi:chromosome partitioning protein
VTWIIAVTGLKGGVGKSTLSITLATTLHVVGYKTLIVDSDPQATARTWASRAADLEHEGPAVVTLDGRQLRRDLERLSSGVDVVVIDTPPRLGIDARAAMLVADVVLLPTTPGAADLWALQESIAVLNEAQAMRPVKGIVVLNRLDRTSLARMARKAIDGFGVPILSATLGARVAFGEAILAGLGVVQHSPASQAAFEAKRLTKAVIAALGENDDVEQ